ncbi:MAG: hypothetical protein CL811_04870 [Colwelliaceae bacterium]|nr:hypothetical protein [Colwelliaceae bacterium]
MYESGGRKSLQIELNVLGSSCGGCKYHKFPYKAQLPIRVDGAYPTWEFKNKDDIWKVTDLIEEETIKVNKKKGMEFDLAVSINAQLPFFTCRNIFLERSMQKDIQRYLYCEKFGTSPYKGDYGEQPCLWVDKVSIIRSALAKLEKNNIDKAKNNG